jgi:hypothetical protein
MAPDALAEAVASPLPLEARLAEMACARACLPHMLVAWACDLEAAVTKAFPCPWDSAYAAALASAWPRFRQHLLPAWAIALDAARDSAELTPAAKASERASAVVSAFGVRQMQSYMDR